MPRAVLLLVLSVLALAGCAAHRRPIPIGVVPDQQYEVSASDEQYGQEVFSNLTQQFTLDNDDARINRVRDVVDKLTKAAKADRNPWHVYVFKDDSFKNAAATRGNYVFVWTGILNTVKDDDELAVILAHEIGHVLAGHTNPDPSEEANEMIAGVAGKVASEVLSRQPGPYALGANIAGALLNAAVKAFLVNPESQRKELEADQVGLFLMAKSGINPEKSIQFWERVKTDPDFGGFPLQFLSTHPATSERLNRLKQILPDAMAKFSGKPDLATTKIPNLPDIKDSYWDQPPEQGPLPIDSGGEWSSKKQP